MKQKFTVQELTTMALLAALLCVSSYISIRLPFSAVPITAQSLIINMIALLLKPKKAGTTVVIWILLGAVGLPVFSNGNAGFGVLAGPTGGYIFGYLIAAILISLARGKKNNWIRNIICVEHRYRLHSVLKQTHLVPIQEPGITRKNTSIFHFFSLDMG